MFSTNLVDYEEIVSHTSKDGYRKYQVGDKEYTSVTMMLGVTKSIESEEALSAWRERLGEEAANKEMTRCSDRGTEVHLALENYVGNKCSFKEAIKNLSFWHQLGMKSVKKLIDKISNVRAQEIPLFSHIFQVAGRVDCVADYDGIPSIIDYKTSTKPKNREWIGDYFLQTAIYSYMLEEMFGLKHEQLVIIIEIEGEPAQVFISNRNEHRIELKQRIKTFRRLLNDR